MSRSLNPTSRSLRETASLVPGNTFRIVHPFRTTGCDNPGKPTEWPSRRLLDQEEQAWNERPSRKQGRGRGSE